MKRLRYENGSLDGIDRRIVRLLVDDALISVADIARRVGLSGPSVSERLRRLEESGTIAGYTVKVNPAGSACRSPNGCASAPCPVNSPRWSRSSRRSRKSPPVTG